MPSSPPPPPPSLPPGAQDDLPQPPTRPRSPHPPDDFGPFFSFTIYPEPGDNDPSTQQGQGENGNGASVPPPSGNDQHQRGPNPFPGSGITWTFHITPGADRPSSPNPNAPNPSFRRSPSNDGNLDQHPTDGTPAPSTNLADDAAPPPLPWLFPPFFNLLMPLRSEPKPDPEKAKELLRSLPSVGKGLLKRVDRVVSAQEVEGEEEEKGWKCGICLEGIEELEQGEMKVEGTGVKALPCNHLYHEACLQPWFTTKHTCPACRLDLDPLQTLGNGNRPEQRRNPLRPTATGSGRTSSPHPYARESSTPAPSGSATEGSPAANTGHEPSHRHLNPSNETSISFFWTIPLRTGGPDGPTSRPPSSQSAEAPAATLPAENAGTVPPPSAAPASDVAPSPEINSSDLLTAPSTPGPIFSNLTHASPLAMDRQPGINRTYSASARQASTDPTAMTIATAPTDQTIAGASFTPSIDNRPRPERRPHIHIFRNTPSPGAGGGILPGVGIPFTPFIINHQRSDQHAPSPTPANENEPKRETTPFVPQSLESWTEEREKSLGWRCDAPECLFAPPTDPDDDSEMADLENTDKTDQEKEMISIYSSLQPIHGVPRSKLELDDKHAKSAVDGEEVMAKTGKTGENPFVILACPHRWHRSCLETAERSAGRLLNGPDVEGRAWVRCARCRKDGWVLPRSAGDKAMQVEATTSALTT